MEPSCQLSLTVTSLCGPNETKPRSVHLARRIAYDWGTILPPAPGFEHAAGISNLSSRDCKPGGMESATSVEQDDYPS